jgi:hypothetical protein
MPLGFSPELTFTFIGIRNVHRFTLQRWLTAGQVSASIAIPMKGRTLWRWTDADLKQVLRFKTANYCKGRGRKRKQRKRR